jgi:hypothetical protein
MSKIMQTADLIIECDRDYCGKSLRYVGLVPYGLNQIEMFDYIKWEMREWQWIMLDQQDKIFCSGYCMEEAMEIGKLSAGGAG